MRITVICQRKILGGHFIVNVWVMQTHLRVETSDDLNDTVDYVKIIEIVKDKWKLEQI